MTTTTKLQALHCYYIGVQAKSLDKHTLAIEWLLEAKRLATIEGKVIDIPDINAELVETIKLVRQLIYKNQLQGHFYDKY